VIDSLAAEGRQQELLRSRTPSSLPGAARVLLVHHLAQNGAAPAHHIIAALSDGRNDAVLDDFDEVFDYYFNKLTETRLLITRRGPPIKFTGRAELTAPAVGSGWWSK
jgi:hypothetical protein